MNTGKKAIIVSFVAGVVLTFIATYLLQQQSLPSIQELRCDVQPNQFLSVSGFEVKILDADVKSSRVREDGASQPRMASFQWRCKVKNISTVTVRYELKIELLDKDAFVLATATVDSQYGEGDLSAGQTHTVYGDIVIDYSRGKTIASSRVFPKALKTNAQIKLEQQGERARQLQAVQVAQDAIRKPWKDLRQGMTKPEVQALLGKPLSVRSFGSAGDWWEYPGIEGTYTSPKVEFSPGGQVKGWTAP